MDKNKLFDQQSRRGTSPSVWSGRRGRWLRLMSCLAGALVLSALVFGGCGEEATSSTQAPATTGAAVTTSGADTTGAPDTTAGADTTTAADDGKVYELKLAHMNPVGSLEDTFLTEWAKKVEEATNGRVKITVYAGATLGAPKDFLSMVRSGVADIVWSYIGYYPGEFKATEVLALPLLLPGNSEENTAVAWDLIENRPEILAEFDRLKLKLLGLHTGPAALLGSKKLVDSVDDVQNMKLRVGGGPVINACKAWGISPVALPPGDIYESLQKNVVDGYIFDPAGVLSFKLDEPVDYFLDLRINANPLFTAINPDKWNDLPADLQEIVSTLSGRVMSLEFARAQDAVVESMYGPLEGQGKTITVPTAEVRAGFVPGAEKAITAWEEEMQGLGIDAAGLVNAVRELVQ